MSASHPEILSLFAARLKARRQAMGLTQQELGAALGLEGRIAQSRISRYEIELHAPDLKTAHELSEALGVSLSALVAESDRLGQIFELVRQLSESQLEELETLLAGLPRPRTDCDVPKTQAHEEGASIDSVPGSADGVVSSGDRDENE